MVSDTVILAPQILVYGPPMADSSGTGARPADADEPAKLVEETELLQAFRRMRKAPSDAAWVEAVIERNAAMHRLLDAIRDFSLYEQELIVSRATRALELERERSDADDERPFGNTNGATPGSGSLPLANDGVPSDDGAR